ncbi:DNA-binding MltR family transcriptional regulator [Mycoplana sp. BE70]|uniref:MltR family transcriptional regulator n=1 Tax=Mycoplana sp. BE70 TaxID=2817775 RepID=UPI00285C0605|nr:MltR family transcriptional regulator [Mycoplana sp. BE70]MDR6755161.1 DNA-binding MltR family transcriptional regulator [Mycoplana sp. BE70]
MGKKAKHDLPHDDSMSAINALSGRLGDLDEQGLVLAAAAFAEDSLAKLLRAFMLPNNAASQLIDGFNAPLGTLSAKVKAAYALGLVTKAQFEDLEHLRIIRNDFSHTWRVVAFSDQAISDRIRSINYSNLAEEFPETPLAKLRSSVMSLLLELEITASQIEKKNLRAAVIGNGLIAGQTGNIDEQIDEARLRISELADAISASDGEKKKFLLMLERRWLSRLTITARNAPLDRRQEVLLLHDELQKRVQSR